MDPVRTSGAASGNRWVGDFRFTLGALYEVWRQKRYAARVAFLPAASSAAAQDMHPAAKDATVPPPNQAAPAADTWQSSPAADNSVMVKDGSVHGRHDSAQQAQRVQAGNGPQQRGDLLSDLCPGGPPTPALDALGRAAELDLDNIAERHSVSA